MRNAALTSLPAARSALTPKSRHPLLLAWLGSALALLSACSSGPKDTMLLLPDPDGRQTALAVRIGTTDLLVNRPYQALSVLPDGQSIPQIYSPQDVQSRYGSLFAMRPAAERNYVLYFATGGVSLTPESAALLPEIVKDLSSRPGGEIMVTGHTDRVGTVQANDQLSLARARTVASWLSILGISMNRIETIGRGEREPLIPTADEVAEPQNRRVEIRVR